jgi:anti-sigma-K factor RskA
MTGEHATFHDNIPAFALGALDAEEAAALQAHLRACDACSRERDEYRAATAPLLAVRAQAPRPASRRPARAPTRRWALIPALSGAAILALLAMDVYALTGMRRLQVQQAELSRELEAGRAALELMASPRSHAVSAQGDVATGALVMDPETMSAVLVLSNLPELDSNQTFQIWLVDPDGGRVSAGLFQRARDSSVTVATLSNTAGLYDYAAVGVTIEPSGGSPGPTGPRVFIVTF